MAECIDREALLHDIEQSVVYTVRGKITSAEMRGAQKIIERIKCAPAVEPIYIHEPTKGEFKRMAVPKWISVDDRLPDETGRYLVVKKRIAPDELGGNRTDIVILRFFVDDGFRMPTHIPDWINEEINEEVTHWMPLPELPKGDNDAESVD